MKIRNEYCPIAGKYRFKYSVNYEYDGLDDNNSQVKDECTSFSSDMNNCPDGSLLHLQFKRCSFEDHGMFILLFSLYLCQNPRFTSWFKYILWHWYSWILELYILLTKYISASLLNYATQSASILMIICFIYYISMQWIYCLFEACFR